MVICPLVNSRRTEIRERERRHLRLTQKTTGHSRSHDDTTDGRPRERGVVKGTMGNKEKKRHRDRDDEDPDAREKRKAAKKRPAAPPA